MSKFQKWKVIFEIIFLYPSLKSKQKANHLIVDFSEFLPQPSMEFVPYLRFVTIILINFILYSVSNILYNII